MTQSGWAPRVGASNNVIPIAVGRLEYWLSGSACLALVFWKSVPLWNDRGKGPQSNQPADFELYQVFAVGLLCIHTCHTHTPACCACTKQGRYRSLLAGYLLCLGVARHLRMTVGARAAAALSALSTEQQPPGGAAGRRHLYLHSQTNEAPR